MDNVPLLYPPINNLTYGEGLTFAAKLLLARLWSLSNQGERSCYCSLQWLADTFGMDRKTATSACKQLENAKIITCIRQPGTRSDFVFTQDFIHAVNQNEISTKEDINNSRKNSYTPDGKTDTTLGKIPMVNKNETGKNSHTTLGKIPTPPGKNSHPKEDIRRSKDDLITSNNSANSKSSEQFNNSQSSGVISIKNNLSENSSKEDLQDRAFDGLCAYADSISDDYPKLKAVDWKLQATSFCDYFRSKGWPSDEICAYHNWVHNVIRWGYDMPPQRSNLPPSRYRQKESRESLAEIRESLKRELFGDKSKLNDGDH